MVTMAKSPQANVGYSSGKPPQVNLFLKLLKSKSILHSLLLQIQEPKAKITLHKKLRRHRPSV
ncbi:hypothetical protein HanIR_Chr11g0556761 [Helianthus annuus]|nr:hypothetical protein HanIR_Chr11g0556761 [Helianthus annuus]